MGGSSIEMFTGIIQAVGTVASRGSHRLEISARLRGKPGDSVAVNGACLTIVKASARGTLNFDISDETLRLTNLGELKPGEAVNLEPALKAGDALGGHMVSGHVDARARVLETQVLPEDFL